MHFKQYQYIKMPSFKCKGKYKLQWKHTYYFNNKYITKYAIMHDFNMEMYLRILNFHFNSMIL
jgi:hypothetical protein